MSATSPGELTASAVIGLIESGAYPRDIVATIARGFLPLAQEDLITILVYLVKYEDEEIAGLARASLGSEIPTRALFEYAANETIAQEHLIRLLDFTTDTLVLEALIRNRAVTDEAVAELAAHAEARVQEVIVINQARILRAPAILDALLDNPQLSPDVRRRALETKEEFFEKKARIQQEKEEAEDLSLPLDAIADLLEKAEEQPQDAPPTLVQLTESEKADDEKASLWTRISFMSIGEKVKLAFRGDRAARMILVRDRHRRIVGQTGN
nr:hypothetical protein [Acidobacteriota bacterium]